MSRDRQVRAYVACELQENAFVWASLVGLVSGDISEYRAIVSGLQAAQMSFQGPGERFVIGVLFQGSRIRVVSEDLDAVLQQNRRLTRQGAISLVGICQSACLDLAGFHVGLIKWIDRDDGTGDRDRNLPAEKFLRKIIAIGDADTDDGMAGFFEFRNVLVLTALWLIIQTDVSEQPIGTIVFRRGEGLVVHRNESSALLAG